MNMGNMMIDVGTNTIETERLILRRFEYEDSTSMLRNWVADDEVQWGYGEPSCSDLLQRCK